MTRAAKAALICNTAGDHQRFYLLREGPADTTVEQELHPGALGALANLTATVDTGLFPDGVVSYRRIGPHEQFAVVLPPTVNKVFWGERERGEAVIYHVAMPYQIVTCEWALRNGAWGLVGCRLFFSPAPVLTLDAPLYHAPVANLNCIGYHGTSVGWVCLYVNGPREAALLTPGERCAYGLLRTSGNEAYNNGNMRATMGPTFYRAHAPQSPQLHNPKSWEQYTDDHGLDWVYDNKLWLPILTNDPAQRKHEPGGAPLTLRRALYDPHVMYYHQDPERPLTSPAAADALMAETLRALITSGGLAGTSYITATKTTHS